MPEPALISVVVPVHGVQQYLTECLDSVLGGPPPGRAGAAAVEVIAVDDASPDGCGRLLDNRADGDSRLTVIHLAQAGGPGNARNIGLARATGRYVWFVDGDDFLPAGALETVADRLTTGRLTTGELLTADQPDVLLIDYEERYPDGSTRPSHGTALLASAPAGSFSLAAAPQLVDLTMTAWSKLFRRDFLLGLGEPFRAGIHEDIPVTCAALLGGRISALNRVCYFYRRSRPGSFMATTSSGHWSVFSAYEEVLDMVRKLVESNDPVATPAVQAALFGRAIWHYASVLQDSGAGIGTGTGVGRRARPGLVPRGERKRFFGRMHADYLRYRPDGYHVPGGARGAKFRLIERNAYRAYELLEPVNKLRVAAIGPLRAAARRRANRGPTS